MKNVTFFLTFFLFYALPIFAAGVGASRPALAERLFLRNGDRISGDVLSKNADGMVILRTPYGAELYIPIEHIMAFQSPPEEDSGGGILKTWEQFSPVEDGLRILEPASGEER